MHLTEATYTKVCKGYLSMRFLIKIVCTVILSHPSVITRACSYCVFHTVTFVRVVQNSLMALRGKYKVNNFTGAWGYLYLDFTISYNTKH